MSSWQHAVLVGAAGDYVPYALNDNTDDVDTLIGGLSDLFAYYPMDDASGLIQDVSGNGNHATGSSGAITYAQPAITSKLGDSIEFDGGYFTLPKPDSGGSGSIVDDGADWTMGFACHLSVIHGTSSPAGGGASIFFGQSGSGAAALLLGVRDNVGEDAAVEAIVSNRTVVLQEIAPIDVPAIVIMSKSGSTTVPHYGVNFILNGVIWSSQGATTTGSNALTIGASDDGFWGWPTIRISNLFMLTRAITIAEGIEITEAMMDETVAAGAYVS